MRTVIFHVGPGKCGSSSIQAGLAAMKATDAPFHYRHVNPAMVRALASSDGAAVQDFVALLRRDARQSPCLIYSHEVCFKYPAALGVMAATAAQWADDIRVIGYSRKPSSFLQSAFCQWLYRVPERAREIADAVVARGLVPSLFSGLERHFMAAIATDFRSARQLTGEILFDWESGYRAIADYVEPAGARLSVGTLPTAAHPFSLLADFLDRCGLAVALTPDFLQRRANSQLDLDLVEAVHMAVLQGAIQPTSRDNGWFGAVTPHMEKAGAAMSPLLSSLKNCVDTLWWPSNQAFAERYGIAAGALQPFCSLSTEDAWSAVEAVQADRASHIASWLADRERIIGRMGALIHAIRPEASQA